MCVKVYDTSNFADTHWSKEFGPGDYIGVPSAQVTASTFQGDDISSVIVYPGCRVDIWENEDRTGWHVSLSDDEPSATPGRYQSTNLAIRENNFDNSASSMKVSNTGGASQMWGAYAPHSCPKPPREYCSIRNQARETWEGNGRW